jgi:recombination protein RecT
MVSNSLVKNQKASIGAYLNNDAVKNQINKMLGSEKQGARFISSLVSAVTVNPALSECDNKTLVNAALLGTTLNLSPSPQLGQFYMVPFNDRKNGRTVAQFQLGYKGYLQLAIRSGQYKKLNVLAIKEGELESYDPLNEEIKVNLIDDEEKREKAKTIGYYAYFEYLNGFRKAMYWSREKMEAHAQKYSKGYAAHKGYTFWEKDFDAMACKTMLRQLISKWGIMSIDMQTAYLADEGAMSKDVGDFGTVDYVDTDATETAVPAQGEVVQEPEKPAESKPSTNKAAEALFKG